ncbi:MAG: ORF6N domain-containing protein [Acidobacteriaceae bacterium]|nr:ORF6N domain-containing protein [Acidobacteriaceae bacterium]
MMLSFSPIRAELGSAPNPGYALGASWRPRAENCARKSLNLAVRRNKDRFPEDFMFQLTREGRGGLAPISSEKRGSSKFHLLIAPRTRPGTHRP